ncbi:unnamed protein product, partial [Phaeothamnion confervicola]
FGALVTRRDDRDRATSVLWEVRERRARRVRGIILASESFALFWGNWVCRLEVCSAVRLAGTNIRGTNTPGLPRVGFPRRLYPPVLCFCASVKRCPEKWCLVSE